MAQRPLAVHQSVLEGRQEDQAGDHRKKELLQDNTVRQQKNANESQESPGQHGHQRRGRAHQVQQP